METLGQPAEGQDAPTSGPETVPNVVHSGDGTKDIGNDGEDVIGWSIDTSKQVTKDEAGKESHNNNTYVKNGPSHTNYNVYNNNNKYNYCNNNGNASSLSSSSQDVCKFFAQGYCSRGNACYYQHIFPSNSKPSAATNSSKSPRQQDSSTAIPMCKFYMLGRCKNSACPFSHVLPDAEVSRHNIPTMSKDNNSDMDDGSSSLAGSKRPVDVNNDVSDEQTKASIPRVDKDEEMQKKAKTILDKRNFRKYLDDRKL
jgi:hypothetical protein